MACANVCINKDLDGRFAVHIAASLGKIKILNWLLSNQAQINAKDQESGYSPLHRAVFFGQLRAVRHLVDRLANISQLDHDRLTCIDHLLQDRLPPFQVNESNECVEAYVWGPNHNATLGQKNQRNIHFPEVLDGFRKENGIIKSVSINKFHSVFVDQTGQVFTCGHGHGGRLGHNSEHSVITPARLKRLKDEVCVQAAIAIDHTILLMETGSVWSFGMNQFNQLGHNPPPTELLAPKCIGMFNGNSKSIPIKGICTSRFHSIFWNSSAVFTCGLNAGQLGHLKGENTIIIPKQVSSLRGLVDAEITIVAASDGATAIATSRGDVYLLHEFQCRKIASKQLDIAKIVMIGGNLDSSVVPADYLSDQETVKLQVILLTTAGKIFIWSSSNSTLARCFFQASTQIFVKDVALSGSSMSLISRQGQGFTGKLVPAANRKTKTAKINHAPRISGWSEFCQREQGYVLIKLERIPGIHRAIGITCDPEGKNFAAIQVHPSVDLIEVPQILPCQMEVDLKQLLMEADPDDRIHDIVFSVERHTFAAHRFILATHCKAFYKDFCENSNRLVTITGIPADMFQLILEFIYTGTCALLQSGPCQLKFNPTGSNYGVIKSVQDCCKKLSVDSLALLLNKVKIKNGMVFVEEKLWCERSLLNRKSREDLCDVSISSQDGKIFRAHRSILSARLEYFHSMFACGWIETSGDRAVSLPIHSSLVEVVLDFCYEDRASKIDKSDDVEFVCNCLTVADQLLISRLVNICESALVRLLTLKNVGELLEFACVYNAPQLKASGLQFICLNLAAVVELRSWDCVSDEVMEELTRYYREFHPAMAYRQITPTSTAPSGHLLDSCLVQERSVHRGENEAKRGKTRARHGQRKHSETKERQISICSNVSTEEVLLPVEDKPKLMNWSTVKKSNKREKQSPSKLAAAQNQNSLASPVAVETFAQRSPAKLEVETVVCAPQNQPTLYESATIIQTTPVSLKSKKFPKLTQKQRRINSTKCDMTSASHDELESQPKPQNVWNSGNNNLDDQSSIGVVPPSFVQEVVKTPMRSIIASEQLQNRNYIAASLKPLKVTLMEEAAMIELRKFYQTDDVHEEYIVVERVLSGLVATPIWRSPQK